MKLIQELTERIEEEISDVKWYARKAVEIKEEYPALAHVLYNISMQEDAHQAALHNEVVKVIEEYRKTHGDPPANMMAVYEYMHKKSIDKLAEARLYQEMYKKA